MTQPIIDEKKYYEGFIESLIISIKIFGEIWVDLSAEFRLYDFLENNKECYLKYLLDENCYGGFYKTENIIDCISSIKNDEQAAIICTLFIRLHNDHTLHHCDNDNDRVFYSGTLYSTAIEISQKYFNGILNVFYVYMKLRDHFYLYKAYPEIYIAELVKFIQTAQLE
jgi:hypothetical protein